MPSDVELEIAERTKAKERRVQGNALPASFNRVVGMSFRNIGGGKLAILMKIDELRELTRAGGLDLEPSKEVADDDQMYTITFTSKWEAAGRLGFEMPVATVWDK